MAPNAPAQPDLSFATAASEILTAEAAVKAAERALETAKTRRAQLRKRHKAHFPLGEFVEVDGRRIRRRRKKGGRTFSLTKYEAKHAITPEMGAFMGRAKPAEVWDIEAG